MANIYKDCIDAAKEALSEFSETELRQYIRHVFNKSEEYKDLGPSAAKERAIKEIGNQQIQNLLEKAQILANDASKFDSIANDIEKGEMNIRESIVRRTRKQSKNIQSAQEANKEILDKAMFHELSAEDVSYLQDKRNQWDIAKAVDDQKYSNPISKKIADVLDKYNKFRNSQMVMKNALSILHVNNDRYLKTIHNPEAMLRGGRTPLLRSTAKMNPQSTKQLWTESVKKFIDLKETFKNTPANELGKLNMESVNTILGRTYDMITEDKYFDPETKQLIKQLFFKWKDFGSFLKYNDQYGRGDLFSAIQQDIHECGNILGTSEMYGSKPFKTYEELKDFQQKIDPKSAVWQRTTNLNFRYMLGMDKTAVSPKLAGFTANMSAFTSMSRLALIVPQSLSDLSYQASFARKWGFNYFHAFGRLLMNLFDKVPNEDRAHLAKLMKTNVQSHLGYIGRFTEAQNMGEITSKLSTSFFKWNTLTGFDRGNLMSGMHMAAEGLYHVSDKKFDSLDSDFKDTIKNFMSVDEWNVLKTKNSRKMFTTDNVDNLSEEEVKDLWNSTDKKTALNQYRSELFRKVYSLLAYAGDHTVLGPDPFIRSLMSQGQKPGTEIGSILKAVMQFKGYAFSYADKVLYQGWKDNKGAGAKALWAAQMFVTTLPLTYLGAVFTNLALGKGMPDFSKMDTAEKIAFIAGMIQPNLGMAMSILDKDQQNPTLLSNIGFNTPTFKFLSNSLATAVSLIEGNFKKTRKELYKSVSGILPVNNIPFVSPYLRASLGEKPYLEPGQKQYFGK